MVFLSIWAVAVVVAGRCSAAHEILLPFILALVVAYVLMPAVEWVEKREGAALGRGHRRVRRQLGGLYVSMAAMAPRLGAEMRGLFRELPAIAATIRDEHVPALAPLAVAV